MNPTSPKYSASVKSQCVFGREGGRAGPTRRRRTVSTQLRAKVNEDSSGGGQSGAKPLRAL